MGLCAAAQRRLTVTTIRYAARSAFRKKWLIAASRRLTVTTLPFANTFKLRPAQIPGVHLRHLRLGVKPRAFKPFKVGSPL